jgi:hypothetical protein
MRSTWPVILVLFSTLAGCASSPAGTNEPTVGSGECNVVGTWVGQVPAGMLMGRVLTMVFSEDHRAQGTCEQVTLNSTWQRNGNLVEVIDVSATPPFAQCDPSLVGRYSLEFSADCASVHAVSGDDPCPHRRQALLGFRASRR